MKFPHGLNRFEGSNSYTLLNEPALHFNPGHHLVISKGDFELGFLKSFSKPSFDNSDWRENLKFVFDVFVYSLSN